MEEGEKRSPECTLCGSRVNMQRISFRPRALLRLSLAKPASSAASISVEHVTCRPFPPAGTPDGEGGSDTLDALPSASRGALTAVSRTLLRQPMRTENRRHVMRYRATKEVPMIRPQRSCMGAAARTAALPKSDSTIFHTFVPASSSFRRFHRPHMTSERRFMPLMLSSAVAGSTPASAHASLAISYSASAPEGGSQWSPAM
mmetsp:Transcript_9855/g.32730  ORF Transcript_9855/g.32730 Transcript_9855/m.32730 type:complete len:202 (-) Transcript_9855:366-971(-)